MKRVLCLLVALLAITGVSAQTISTPNVGLQLPAAGSTNWNLPLNYNFNLLDQLFGGLLTSGNKLAYRPLFTNGSPVAICNANNQGQIDFDYSTSPFTQYACHGTSWSIAGGGGGGGGASFPTTPGVVWNTDNVASRNATGTDIVGLWAGGGCSGFLKSDLTCGTGAAPSTVTSNDGSVNVAHSGSNYDLHVLSTQCYLGDGGLVGSLTDGSGVLKLPICVGKGPSNFTVPSGATQLNLGIDDDLFSDNTGSFSVRVIKNAGSPSTVSVPGTTMPWNPTTNPNYTFGMNDGTSGVVALSGLVAGDVVTIEYLSGTVKMSVTYPSVDANGYLTDPPGQAVGGGPTGSALAPSSTFYPTKYTVANVAKALTGLIGDVQVSGPGVASSLLKSINGVPLCASITPGNGKVWTYTTASSPNPCYDLETPASGFTAAGDLSGSSSSQTVIGILGQALPSLSAGYPHWNGTTWLFDTPSTGAVNGRVISSSTTAACGEYIRSDASTSVTVTLPTIIQGCTVVVQRNGTGSVVIDPNGATYDGVTTQLIQGTQAFVWTDGAGYHSTSPILPGSHCSLTPGITDTFDCTGAVSSVSNSDGTLTISPTAGAVVASCTAATTSQSGCVEPDGVTTNISGGKLVAVAGAPSGAAGGDLAGTYPNPTVSNINGAIDVLSNQVASGTRYHGPYVEQYAATSGTPITLLSKTGSGVVNKIWVAVNTSAYQFFEQSKISISTNGEGSPHIVGTIDSLSGMGYVGDGTTSGTNIQNAFFAANSGGSNATTMGITISMKVPYSNGITITLTPSATQSVWAFVEGDTLSVSWPYTKKLWIQSNCRGPAGSLGLCGGSVHDSATANYAQETVLNFASSTKGRLAGLSLLSDGGPGTLSPSFSVLEGNYRIFIDQFNSKWAASTSFTAGKTIMDTNGNLQTSGGGTSNSTIPSTWGCYTGATTTDNSITWTATVSEPSNVWRASTPYSLACAFSVLDASGNYVMSLQTAGTTSGSQPTCTSAGQTITDNTATWKCSLLSSAIKAAINSTGSEDIFFSNGYGAGQPANTVGNAEFGIEYPKSTNTVGFFRFFLSDPLRFQNSIAIFRQNGDSSQGTFTGTATSLQTVWFYNEDTN